MQSLANTDSLTSVSSRRHAEALLEEELTRAQRYNRSLSVALVDLDHFKKVNDLYGHDVGDAVLRELSELLRHGIRSVDHVGRWGGEEFILLLPELTSSEARHLASRLRLSIEQYDFSRVGRLTASFGIASSRPEDTPTSFVKRADEALYRAKAAGRNTVHTTRAE